MFAPSFLPLNVPDAGAAKLTKLGLRCPFDLLLHLPLRYEDETLIHPIVAAPLGQFVQIEAEVIHQEITLKPRRQLVCQLQDRGGILCARFLHFYPNQQAQLAVGKRVILYGEIRQGFYGLEMVHPRVRSVTEERILADTLSPVYPNTAGLSPILLRKWIEEALHKLPLYDTLPAYLLKRLNLPDFASALQYLHHPPPEANQFDLQERTHPAWQRIKFDELLAQQLSMRKAHQTRALLRAPSLLNKNKLTQKLYAALPFKLTAAQQRVMGEISLDMTKPHPMQRLLQGDVGSGKTIIAAFAALQAIESGYQVALMAPTEILAEQHAIKFREWFAPLGIEVAWLSGSLKKAQKIQALAQIAGKSTKMVIGTHALFQEQVVFSKLGLAIVDEQHRFGVQQRLALREKSGALQPHQLMMTATPIPRTLSMSYYADLDVSIIDELPPNRTPIVTKLLPMTRRDAIIQRTGIACRAGKQAYWVCPLIEESEKLQLQTAIDTFTAFQMALPDLQIGLVHGRMKPAEKAQVMQDFVQNKIQLLVATSVIEVGVDVPNASMMMIEHAERMGLSQLHQLRGRVGRGQAASFCLLLYQDPLSELARIRLRVMAECTDGFEIARQDLLLRGPGEFLGVRQSGVPMLRFADLEKDFSLLEAARKIADKLLADYPDVAAQHLDRWMGAKADLLMV